MPGPKSTPNGTVRDKAKPNRKTAARMAARTAGFSKSNDKFAGGYHLPGSQNRNV